MVELLVMLPMLSQTESWKSQKSRSVPACPIGGKCLGRRLFHQLDVEHTAGVNITRKPGIGWGWHPVQLA